MCFNQLTEQQGKRFPFAVLDRLFTYENPLYRTGFATNSYSRSFIFIGDIRSTSKSHKNTVDNIGQALEI